LGLYSDWSGGGAWLKQIGIELIDVFLILHQRLPCDGISCAVQKDEVHVVDIVIHIFSGSSDVLVSPFDIAAYQDNIYTCSIVFSSDLVCK
jgi:hypothetical protein